MANVRNFTCTTVHGIVTVKVTDDIVLIEMLYDSGRRFETHGVAFPHMYKRGDDASQTWRVKQGGNHG